MTWVMWNLISFSLEIVLVSVQDRCTVCAKRTIDLEIVEARFGPFRDSVNLDARYVHGLR